MLLIGQFDSPYVRRVGIALKMYGIPFVHEAYAVFRDAEKIAAYNPLRKVPTLVLEDGTVLSESFVCLEVIDERVAAEQPERRLLLPRSGLLRREGLRIGALCSGICEKAVSLVYDRELRQQHSPVWTDRCVTQVRETLVSLEATCARRLGTFMLEGAISHADIAATCTLTFVEETRACPLDGLDIPALRELAARCEALPEFESVKQPFHVPR
jgi:glutathione S-transferase